MSEYLQNATDAAVDEKLGIVAIRLAYLLKPNTGAGETPIKHLRRALTYQPTTDLADLSPLAVIKRTAKQNERDGAYLVSFDLEGHFSPDSADGEEFNLEGSTSEDKIEAHPDIQMLLEKYNGKRDDDDGKITFPIFLEVNGQKERNPMHGVESYFVPSLVWTRSWVGPSFSDSIVRALGTIDTPGVGRRGQRPPSLSGGRNWLKMRAKADWRGNIWKVSESWMLSGPGGWNPDVYRYK